MCSEQEKIEKNSLPQRTDIIYKEIENIKKFEFTLAVVYEFARRNEKVQLILNFLNDTFKLYAERIYPNKNFNISDFDKLKQCFIGILITFNKKEFVNEIKNSVIDDSQRVCSMVVEILAEELYEVYYLIYKTDMAFSSLIYNQNRFIERDPEFTRHVYETEEDYISENENYKYNFDSNEYYIFYQAVYKNEKKFKFNTFYPNYKTALRNFTDTKILLNLSLPKEEILDFIKKIKNDYDANNSSIKNIFQLLGEEIDMSPQDIEDMSAKEWADSFFIYDYIKSSKDKNKQTKYQKLQEIFTKNNGYKIKKTPAEIREDKKRRDNSLYKIISIEVYELFKDNYKNKKIKPFISIKTLEERFKLIDIFTSEINYKRVIHN